MLWTLCNKKRSVNGRIISIRDYVAKDKKLLMKSRKRMEDRTESYRTPLLIDLNNTCVKKKT